MENKKRITVWPEDENTWIVSRDDESSDTIAVFGDEDSALARGREASNAENLPLYRQDEHGATEYVRRGITISGNWADDHTEAWAGDGTVDEYGNIECSADIADSVYSAIEDQIREGRTSGSQVADESGRVVTYNWELI